MSNTIKGWAVHEQGQPFAPFEWDAGELGPNQIEINVESCGICHSDLNMINNDFWSTDYPFVPGHEVVGKVGRVGSNVSGLTVGQRVGLGWYNSSCMNCEFCIGGSHNFCPQVEPTIMDGKRGGFAEKVRCHYAWATPVPETLDPSIIGPLFCAGSTVFNPILEFNIQSHHRVGVVGLGGLGHLAVKFLRAWGCHVTVFSSTPDKEKEAKELGAHHFASSGGENGCFNNLGNSFDFIISTLNVELKWEAFIAMLRPRGRLHIVGLAPKIESSILSLLGGQKSISSSPVGSPSTTRTMLKFVENHPECLPIVEKFPFNKVNEAIDRLKNGKPRFRVVLSNS
jgi:uncharacterized zinc-type alcohol dehydrogenase-like protein